MSSKTTNYNMTLPAQDEYYNVDIFNDNYTIIDEVIHTHESDGNNPHGVTKEQVGLGNADNTADLEKPISNAVQEALDNLTSKISGGVTIYTVNADTFAGGYTMNGKPYKEIYTCSHRIVYLGLLQGYGTVYKEFAQECGLSIYNASATQGAIGIQVDDTELLTGDIKLVIVDLGKYEGGTGSDSIIISDL